MEATTEAHASLRPSIVLAATAIAIYIADQLTKALVVANLDVGEYVSFLGDLIRVWYVQNSGASFGILPGALWLFVPVTVVALVMVAWFHRSLHSRTPWIHVVLGMVLAGTVGNLTDRLRLGYVIDFVSVGFGEVRFPTFNVADASLVVGIILLVGFLTFIDRPASHGPDT